MKPSRYTTKNISEAMQLASYFHIFSSCRSYARHIEKLKDIMNTNKTKRKSYSTDRLYLAGTSQLPNLKNNVKKSFRNKFRSGIFSLL